MPQCFVWKCAIPIFFCDWPCQLGQTFCDQTNLPWQPCCEVATQVPGKDVKFLSHTLELQIALG